MSVQEKYQTLIDLANQNGTSVTLSEVDGVLHVDGTAPSDEAKQQLWDEYNRIDPDYRSGDLVLNVTSAGGAAGGGSTTYTVVSGDSLSKIGSKYGVSWNAIFEANKDKIDDPDKIFPGQELTIPQG
ncbi:MAG: LysM peptidoglycan-binding domain-containing protein [Pyrinomonadaceae bacterium]